MKYLYNIGQYVSFIYKESDVLAYVCKRRKFLWRNYYLLRYRHSLCYCGHELKTTKKVKWIYENKIVGLV
jgi:hypothetical protein